MPASIGLMRPLLLVLLVAPTLAAQERAAVVELSLEEALARAEATSEPLAIAEAGVLRAQGERLRARAAYYPEITASAAYTHTFASEFSGFGGEGGVPPDTGAAPPDSVVACGPFAPDPTQPLGARVDTLEVVVACLAAAAAGGPGGPAAPPDLASLFGGGFGPFGSPHRYDIGLFLTFPIYTGGRRVAQTRIAEAGRRRAEVEVRAQRAQLALDVTRAYFDALLAARLLDIAEQTLAQAERTLAVTLVAVEAGDQAEFDALRARVARDNQRAEVVRRRAERDVAFSRLRTLVGAPLDRPIALTTPLGDEVPPAVAKRAPDPAGPDTAAELRSTVRQAAENVRIQQGRLEIARSQRRPQVVLSGQLGQVAFPIDAVPRPGDFRTTASLTIGAELPLFTGGRLRGDELVALADVREATARFEELRDLAAEDARVAIDRLNAARAAFDATGGTIQEAERAYAIAELRYREGVASLLELNDTRLLLEEALANRAVAARDLQVAQTRLILLPDLPLDLPVTIEAAGTAGLTGAAGTLGVPATIRAADGIGATRIAPGPGITVRPRTPGIGGATGTTGRTGAPGATGTGGAPETTGTGPPRGGSAAPDTTRAAPATSRPSAKPGRPGGPGAP
ncbi:MAG TPA: TolC family protein [Longimicrobiales bacterium]